MNYTIRFTNPAKASFVIVENKTNGPASPNTTALMPDAVSANTTLQLLGQGRVQYGQPVWQDFVYMLENYANGTPPSYPIQGQLWYNDSALTMNVYDGTDWQPIQSGAISGDLNMNGHKITNVAPPTDSDDVVTLGYADTAYVNVSGDAMGAGANLSFNGGQVLGLPAVPTTNTAATSKLYVDNEISAVEAQLNGYLPLTGGTLTGTLTISSGNLSVAGTLGVTGDSTLTNTTINGTATVSGATSLGSSLTVTGTTQLNGPLNAASTSTFNSPVNIIAAPLTISSSGSIDMSGGFINNLAYPLTPSQAVNKQYVDDQILGGGGGNITGGDISTVDGVITLYKPNGDIVLTGSAAPFTHSHTALEVSVNAAGMTGNVISKTAFVDSTYPSMAGQRAFQVLDVAASTLLNNNQRYEQLGTGAATITLPFKYKVGSHKLQAYVNGALQTLSNRSIAMFAFETLISGPNAILTVPGTYSFNITVNGTLYSNISINVAPTLSFDGLVTALNSAFNTNAIPATAYIDNNTLCIATTSVGAGSLVTIADPTSGTSLVDELVTNQDAVLTNGIGQLSGGYQEVGAYGVMSKQITFASAPTASDVVTVICQPHLGALVGLV